MKYISKNKNGKGYKSLSTKHLKGCSYEGYISNDKTNNITIRTDVLTDLLKEQNYNCAYCMKEITIKNAKIEHFISQNFNDNKNKNYNILVEKYQKNIEDIIGKIKPKDKKIIGQVHDTNYNNMLAVCKGNNCGNSSHCDASRSAFQGKRPLLFISPFNKQQMIDIHFSQSGLVYYIEPISKKNLLENIDKKLKDIEKWKKQELEYLNLDMDTNIRYDLYCVLNLNCDSIREKRKRVLNAINGILRKIKFNKKQIQHYLSSFEEKYTKYSNFVKDYGEFSQVAIFELKKHIKE